MGPVTGEMDDLPAFKETGFIFRCHRRLDDMLGHVLSAGQNFRHRSCRMKAIFSLYMTSFHEPFRKCISIDRIFLITIRLTLSRWRDRRAGSASLRERLQCPFDAFLRAGAAEGLAAVLSSSWNWPSHRFPENLFPTLCRSHDPAHGKLCESSHISLAGAAP